MSNARPHSANDLQSADGAFAITPDDGADLPFVTRAIFIKGNASLVDLAVVMVDGSEVTFAGLATGIAHPFQVKRVLATGTTATGIIGLL